MTSKMMVSASGFCQNGSAQTLPIAPCSDSAVPVGCPLFIAADVATVLFALAVTLAAPACIGCEVAPPISENPGRFDAYAPDEITGCGAGGATTAFAGATGTSCPFTTAEKVLIGSVSDQGEKFQRDINVGTCRRAVRSEIDVDDR